MTVQAKSVVNAFYGSAPQRSYWVGCSSGGKQGLKEAQKFPADYDGIAAGAPANYWTHLIAQSLWVTQATLKDPASTSRARSTPSFTTPRLRGAMRTTASAMV